jgi:hypothetical protein
MGDTLFGNTKCANDLTSVWPTPCVATMQACNTSFYWAPMNNALDAVAHLHVCMKGLYSPCVDVADIQLPWPHMVGLLPNCHVTHTLYIIQSECGLASLGCGWVAKRQWPWYQTDHLDAIIEPVCRTSVELCWRYTLWQHTQNQLDVTCVTHTL